MVAKPDVPGSSAAPDKPGPATALDQAQLDGDPLSLPISLEKSGRSWKHWPRPATSASG